jgi:hypothetical protein
MKIKMYGVLLFFGLLSAQLLEAWPLQQIHLSAVATNGGVILTWTAPTPPLGTTLISLDVRYDTSPIGTLNWTNHQRVVWLTDPGQPGTVQTAVVTGLSPNSYYFALRTENSLVSWSTMSTLSLALIGGSTYHVLAAWNTSSDPSVVGYKVYYGGASGTYTNMVDAGNATSVPLTGLVYGVTYYGAATTYSASGMESPFSDEISWHWP